LSKFAVVAFAVLTVFTAQDRAKLLALLTLLSPPSVEPDQGREVEPPHRVAAAVHYHRQHVDHCGGFSVSCFIDFLLLLVHVVPCKVAHCFGY